MAEWEEFPPAWAGRWSSPQAAEFPARSWELVAFSWMASLVGSLVKVEIPERGEHHVATYQHPDWEGAVHRVAERFNGGNPGRSRKDGPRVSRGAFEPTCALKS